MDWVIIGGILGRLLGAAIFLLGCFKVGQWLKTLHNNDWQFTELLVKKMIAWVAVVIAGISILSIEQQFRPKQALDEVENHALERELRQMEQEEVKPIGPAQSDIRDEKAQTSSKENTEENREAVEQFMELKSEKNVD